MPQCNKERSQNIFAVWLKTKATDQVSVGSVGPNSTCRNLIQRKLEGYRLFTRVVVVLNLTRVHVFLISELKWFVTGDKKNAQSSCFQKGRVVYSARNGHSQLYFVI